MPARIFVVLPTIFLIIVSSCKSPESPTEPVKPKPTPVDSLVDPAIQPKVIATWPGINSQGPYAGFYPANQSQLQIRFNKKMDVSSVFRAVDISAPGGNIKVDTNLCTSYGGTNFSITPTDSTGHLLKLWTVGQAYTFTISTSARDVNGNHLQPVFSMSFTPEPYLRITAVTESLQTNSPFIMNFNSLVDTSIISSIHITPFATGSWYISFDSMSACAYPLYLLMSDSTYTVTVTTDAHDKLGNYLPSIFTSTLRSVMVSEFRIITVIPNSTANSLFQSIYIGCTKFIDTSTIRPAFHISPKVTGYFFIPNDVYYYFKITRNYIPETSYTVTIDSTLRESNGPSLSAPYVFTFKTPPFRIDYNYPADKDTGVPPAAAIDVTLNGFIDITSVPASFHLVDRNNNPVTGTLYTFDYGFYFEPSPSLMQTMEYRATITTALHTPEGISLKSEYTFSFKTGM